MLLLRFVAVVLMTIANATRIYEDNVYWICQYMGNHICGR